VQVILGRKPLPVKDLTCKKHSICELWTLLALGRKVAGVAHRFDDGFLEDELLRSLL
jgi:hypothetical protein